MGRKRKNNKIPKVHEALQGLDLQINAFGEIISNINVDHINQFLLENVPDKKLINRYDDKYQQEFKALGFGQGGDEEETTYVEPAEEEEDNVADFLKD